jgi:Bacterial Ig-like domain (group 3)/FG-GAP-like repeat
MLKRKLSGLALCALLGSTVAHAGQFLQAPQYPTGTNPQAMALGDFNGDGNLDVAIANASSNTVSVLLGNGDGTFKPKVDYATGKTPLGIAVGDFNGDGHFDIAVTNSASNTVSIFLGNGDGTFRAKTDYPTGRMPQGIAVADFNSDGNPDIAVANAADGSVAVLLGRGDGTFKPGVAYNTGSNPVAVAVGDFNQDSIPDLAVANSASSTVSVLLGVGDGTFHTQSQFVTGATPVAIALADFNGDGYLDIAVADQNGVGACILLGKGNGSFQTRMEYATAINPTGIAVGDFNGDGKLDLAISAAGGNTVSVLWGNGDGTFRGYVNCGTGDVPSSVAAADFNNDGRTDIAVTDSGGNSVSVILSNGNRTFQAHTDYPAGIAPYSVATADFNGDGILDLAVANNNCPTFPNCGEGTVSVLLGKGDGSFTGATQYSTGPETDPISIVVGDFNGDGIPDLAVANNNTNTLNYVTVLLGNGDGTFQTALDFLIGSGPASVAVGDFNSDGKLDLVVTNFTGNNISVLSGNGDGTFANAINYNVGNGPVALAVGDFNGDHKLDLAVVNETDNTISILLGNGDGTFKGQVVYSSGTGGNPLAVVAGDFNGDHNLDLAIANNQTQQVSVLLGNGDGSFQPFKNYQAGANPVSITTADFNGDGKLDLALTSAPLGSSPGNQVSLLLGNGDGTFALPTLYGTGAQALSVVVGDFNGDGAPDVLVANGGSNTVSVLLNTRNTTISTVSSVNPSAYGQSVTFTTTVEASIANGTAPTGTVTLKNGSTVVGSGSLVRGQASISTTTLPVGSDSLSAIYSGDSNYQSTAVGFAQTVQAAGTSTTLVSSVNPAYPSQVVTFTATVASNTTGTPSGSVAFLDGTSTIGTSAVNGIGVATFSTSTLSVGTHNITASYGGDGNFTASTSPLVSQVVQKASTTTTVSSSVNPSTINQSITLTAKLSWSNALSPTGSVTFLDGMITIGSAAVNGSGLASFSFSTLGIGTHNITADYGGDNSFNPSTSPLLSQMVQQGNTSIALVSSANPSTVSQSVNFTATVSSGTGITPTGAVKFMDGLGLLGSSSLNSGGVAAFSSSMLSAGTHSLTAVYSGDANSDPSTSPVVSQVVQKAGTSVALGSSLNPSSYEQSVILTATVTSGAAATPSGTVTFSTGSTTLGSSALNASGVATLLLSTLAAGSDSLTATYSGDANCVSSSAVLNQVVQKANTSTALGATPTAANLNQAVTFTAIVTPQSSGIPTGSMNFMDGTTQLGASPLNGSGVAIFSTATLSAGTHSITAAYSGDANFNVSSSTAVVLPVVSPAFSISATALSPSPISPGGSAKSTVTVSASGGFNPSTVSLACTVSPAVNPPVTCSLGAMSVVNGVGTSTLTAASAGPRAALSPPFGEVNRGTLFAIGLLFPAILLSGQGLRKRGQRKSPRLCFICLVFVGCLLQVACGAGVSSPAPAGNSGTPSGMYSVTVTGSASGAPLQTASVSVMVQ